MIPSGGLSEQLATAAAGSGQPVIALPPEQCDPVMFGPSGTFDPSVLDAAHDTYAPDSLWDTSPRSIERFVSLFAAAPSVDASVMRNADHSIDHPKAAPALHLRQLAFAHECTLRAQR